MGKLKNRWRAHRLNNKNKNGPSHLDTAHPHEPSANGNRRRRRHRPASMEPVAVIAKERMEELGKDASLSPAPTNAKDTDEAEPGYRALGPDAAAVAAVRAFRQDPGLKVDYVATAANPYRADSADLDIYDDEHGFEYWLDPADARLLQAAPRAGFRDSAHAARPGQPKPVPALRELALATAEKLRPGFGDRLSGFHPYEDNRRGQLFFFRWETPCADENELPPFLQVGLYADGELACLTDTLPAEAVA